MTPASFPEGITNYRITPYDPDYSDPPRPSNPWTVKIDRTAPDLTLGGALSDRAGSGYVTADTTLTFDARDGIAPPAPCEGGGGEGGGVDGGGPDTGGGEPCPDPGPTGPQASGVSRIDIQVDDPENTSPPEQTYTPTCAGSDNCSASETYTFSIADKSEREYSVTVVAFDRLNHQTSKTVRVSVDLVPPVLAVSGPLKELDGAGVDATADLRVEASGGIADGNPRNAPAGVKSIEVQVDGERAEFLENPSPCDACPLRLDWTYSSVDYPSGSHTIMVTATDLTGNPANTTSQSWDVFSSPSIGGNRDEPVDPLDDGSVEDLGEPSEPICIEDPESMSNNYCGEEDATNPADVLAQLEPPLDLSATEDYFDSGPAAASPSPFSLDPGGDGYGLSDNRPQTFSDPRFPALGIKKFVRLIVPWDVVPRASATQRYNLVDGSSVVAKPDPKELEAVDEYMDATKDRFEVLVSFEFSVPAKGVTNAQTRKILPTIEQYRDATEAFRARYREREETVKAFTAWNEPNHVTQPTGEPNSGSLGPRRAGQYYKNLKKRCIGECTVAAGDFLDRKSQTKFYVQTYMRYAGPARIWAYHAYTTGDTENSGRFRKFLKATARPSGRQPLVWLTEQGPQYHNSTVRNCELVGDQKLQYLLRLPNISKRITRFYYYAWTGNRGGFDSGLIDPVTMQARKGYYTYKTRTNPLDPGQYTGNPPC